MSEEIIINKSKNPNVLNLNLNEDKGLSISNSYLKNRHKLKLKNNRFKNCTESNYNKYDDYFEDNFKSVQDSKVGENTRKS